MGQIRGPQPLGRELVWSTAHQELGHTSERSSIHARVGSRQNTKPCHFGSTKKLSCIEPVPGAQNIGSHWAKLSQRNIKFNSGRSYASLFKGSLQFEICLELTVPVLFVYQMVTVTRRAFVQPIYLFITFI